MKHLAAFSVPTVLVAQLLILSNAFLDETLAQPEHGAESAAEVFKQTLDESGIEVASAKFREMMADTSGTYSFDGRELIYAARGLVWEGRRNEAIELYKLLTEFMPDSHWPYFDLGCQYIYALDKVNAENALSKAHELAPDELLIELILERIDDQIEIARVQAKYKNKYVPGENTGIEGPYLGEEPPGSAPKIFANGILNSEANEFSISFSPDGKEIYFSRAGEGVLICKWEEAGWTAPELVKLGGDSLVCDEANVSPDGETILFNGRPGIRGGRQIYIAEREGDGWGVPKRIFEGMYATSTLGGSVYYTVISDRSDIGVLGRRVPGGEGYSDVEILEGPPNTEHIDAHPFVAPDESFILFDSSRAGGICLFVCFRMEDGSWGDAICLNDHLEIPRFVGQSTVSPDGKYLFYSWHNDIFWVSADIIDRLRPH